MNTAGQESARSAKATTKSAPGATTFAPIPLPACVELPATRQDYPLFGAEPTRWHNPRVFEAILYETTGHVGVITLNRRESPNALTHRTCAELEQVVRDAAARVVRCLACLEKRAPRYTGR